ncbi:MAG: 2-succinyl-5-enolpyruvyl-6-hydroxy-3-cyclohexene-1-carboxylic-acid synthase [Muribaculaceae bacterium]|nr:2-succinyl-5-enolpyruvyl-6-hydroxy-3-cyclohexene-1-carboxylic-acid synthase [Muribaculaceae bacterium]
MKDTDHYYCRILLDVLEAHGVKDIIASPGSRNAPLLISCSYRSSINVQVITDERTAAFFALGVAAISRKPVALICTSGTALYNYAPAIAEAFYQGLPLIVISADRPYYWIDQNDSQTLIQPGSLSKIVKGSFNIPVESPEKNIEWYVNRISNEAAILSTDGKPGPVHINVEIEAPISGIKENTEEIQRSIRTIPSAASLHPRYIEELRGRLAGKRILVVAGFMPPDDRLNKYLKLFATLPGVVILCETLSNLHISGNPYAIDSVISGLSEEMKSKLRPDIVISIGGALVSRMLKEFIRKDAPEVWSLGDSYFGIDCFQNLSVNIQVEPGYFFKVLYYSLLKRYRKEDIPQKCSEYPRLWENVKSNQLALRERFVAEAEWSELKAFQHILETLPRNYNLFLSNGTSVRYAQLFTHNIPHASYSNRGVSGIEGTTATAAGCAFAYNGPTVLITGDMSFAYAPGVLGLDMLPPSFKIVVINNRGGGIFRFISPTRYIEHRDRFFCADPKVLVEGLAQAYGWKYFAASSEDELAREYTRFLTFKKNAVLEIFADEEYSATLLRKYMRINFENASQSEK